MTNIPGEWLEKAITEGHITYLEFDKFTNPVVIGQGGFGKVIKYEWKGSELTVALKSLRVDRVDTSIDEKSIKSFIHELKLLRRVCSHPNFIAFHGITKDSYKQYNMVLQYADEGTLREYLKKKFNHMLWTDKLSIAIEIAHGILFLHDNNIIHQDLHSKNILIHQGKPKIADFGLSKDGTSIDTSSSATHGMLAYIDPRCCFDNKYKRNNKSDIYSFGIILWEISSGKPPFESYNNFMLIGFISSGTREKPVKGTPPQYIELYKQCWDDDPAERPEARSVLDTLKELNQLFTIEDNENYSSFANSRTNSIDITASNVPYLSDAQYSIILENLRKEAYECFEQCKFLKALEHYKAILEHSQHNEEDKKDASTWNLFYGKCRLKNLDELIKALDEDTILTSLNLRDNKLGVEGGKKLAVVLCKNTTLKELDLSFNNLGSEGGKALADALCKNFSLTSLNLTTNKFESEGGIALANTLFKNITLTSLNLENNNLGSEGGKALAAALCENTTLTSLDLPYNKLGTEGGKALAVALCKNTTLKNLNISFNDLGLEGGKALADAFGKNTALISVGIQYNRLESEGGKELADALCKNTTLKELNLSFNNLGSEGGKALANALCKNTTLEDLNLYGNFLGSGGKTFANALCKNNTLTSLNLENNNLGSEEGKALADALNKNTTLISLNLRGNDIGSEVFALCRKTTLKFLDLSLND